MFAVAAFFFQLSIKIHVLLVNRGIWIKTWMFVEYFGIIRVIIPFTRHVGPCRASQWTVKYVRVYSHVEKVVFVKETTEFNKVYCIYFAREGLIISNNLLRSEFKLLRSCLSNFGTFWTFSLARKLQIENGFCCCNQHIKLHTLRNLFLDLI